MIHRFHYLALGAVMTCANAMAQDTGMPPARTLTIGAQRVGDLVVQGAVIPTWYIPQGVAVAVPANQAQTLPPPTRMAATPTVTSTTGTSAAPSTSVTAAPAAIPAPPLAAPTTVAAPGGEGALSRGRTTSDWRSKVDAIAADIEANKQSLVDAQAQMLVAAEDEKRTAEEQVAAAQRRLEASKKQAQRAKALVASLQPAPEPVVESVPNVASTPAATPQTQATPQPTPSFALRRQDRTIPAALTRWAEDAGYTLLWEAAQDPASYEETYEKPFPEAVESVIHSLKLAGRDLLMCEYTNKVVRVVPRSAACKINPKDNKAGATE